MKSAARLHRFTPVYGEWPVCDLCGEREDAPIHKQPEEPSAAQDQKLAVRAEMWTRKGEWQILVRAPEWVVDDFARHGSMSNGRRVWVHNFGGGVGGYSFLLGTVEVEPPSRRERFARWLLRVPRRRFATH